MRKVAYDKNGYRTFTMPEWTKSLNNNATMTSREVADIIGVTYVHMRSILSHGLFPAADAIPTKYHDRVLTHRWSVKFLRSLESKDSK